MAHDNQDEERQRLFARNLRAARERAGLTQAAIAAKLGMEDEVYARYEMWPSLDRLGRICDILGCTSDSLLGTDQPPPRPARPPAKALEDDSPEVRRLLRRLRKARPKTLRLVRQTLDELDQYGKPAPGDARAPAAPGSDAGAAAGASSGDDSAAAGAVPGDGAGAAAGDTSDEVATTPAGGAPRDDGGTGEP
jgi:transcriptional regulator with XRE-family HTH domain